MFGLFKRKRVDDDVNVDQLLFDLDPLNAPHQAKRVCPITQRLDQIADECAWQAAREAIAAEARGDSMDGFSFDEYAKRLVVSKTITAVLALESDVKHADTLEHQAAQTQMIIKQLATLDATVERGNVGAHVLDFIQRHPILTGFIGERLISSIRSKQH